MLHCLLDKTLVFHMICSKNHCFVDEACLCLHSIKINKVMLDFTLADVHSSRLVKEHK